MTTTPVHLCSIRPEKQSPQLVSAVSDLAALVFRDGRLRGCGHKEVATGNVVEGAESHLRVRGPDHDLVVVDVKDSHPRLEYNGRREEKMRLKRRKVRGG